MFLIYVKKKKKKKLKLRRLLNHMKQHVSDYLIFQHIVHIIDMKLT